MIHGGDQRQEGRRRRARGKKKKGLDRVWWRSVLKGRGLQEEEATLRRRLGLLFNVNCRLVLGCGYCIAWSLGIE